MTGLDSQTWQGRNEDTRHLGDKRLEAEAVSDDVCCLVADF